MHPLLNVSWELVMLLLLPIIVALAGDPTPAASSSPRPTPLTEIGRVRALPACVPIVAHANGAITEVLDNDRLLAIISTNLRATDFDNLTVMQRRNAIDIMLRHAETIGKAATSGDIEIKRLREYALSSPDPKRKEELKAFTDAIGGAIYRQKKAALEFQRDIAIIRGREEVQDARDHIFDSTSSSRTPIRPGAMTPVPVRPTPSPDPQYDKHFKFLADKFDDLKQGILRDEGVAADHSIAATSGC